jgi:hypothetical protein
VLELLASGDRPNLLRRNRDLPHADLLDDRTDGLLGGRLAAEADLTMQSKRAIVR